MTNLEFSMIVVKFDRPDLGTDYAVFDARQDRLFIHYGKRTPLALELAMNAGEELPFDRYPEAAALYDGCGWNADELRCFVSNLVADDQPTEPVAAISNEDVVSVPHRSPVQKWMM